MPILRDAQDSLGVRSVIDPYHPGNRTDHNDADGNYIYRTRRRSKKLNFTLGWELEANHVPTRIPKGINHISDGSVNGDGAEFVVLPAITKSPKYVLGLLKELVHAPKLNTDKSCGYHVHVSASNLTIREMREWAIATEHLAMMIEDAAFKAVPDARQSNSYCRRIRPITNGTSFHSRKYSNDRRYHWLNTVEMFRPGGIHTLENRLLGNTHRWKYVLAWSLFSMELARRGWELTLKPFDSSEHVNALTEMLQRITVDVKPLEKRGEPVPQWVYDGLKLFDIPADAWDRPLAKLSEAECDVKGMLKKFYSDNQATEANEDRSDDEDSDDNSCSCGCGEDGTCSDQLHSDGDCDSSYCSRCHEDGDCTGAGRCDFHITSAHEDGEDCTRDHCNRCARIRAQNEPEEAASVTPVTATAANVVIHESNPVERRSGWTVAAVNNPSEPITADSMRRAINELRHTEIDAIANTVIDNAALQLSAYAAHYNPMRDAMLYGVGLTSIVWDEGNARPIERTEDMEYRAMQIITTTEMLESERRVRNSNGGI